jgi:hypothetical protein
MSWVKTKKEARMKKLGKFKLFILLIFLSVALVFVGVNFVEADKPDNPGKKPPKWEWKVEIPNEDEAVANGCNLYGNNEIFENNEFVEVEYWTYEDTDIPEFNSVFSLKIRNTEKDSSMDPGYYSIGFRDLQFIGCKSYCFLGGEGPCRCWVFPNSPYPEGVDCSADGNCELINCCGPTSECGSDGFWVMEDFMEDYAHPCYGYELFGLRFWVNTDVEAIEIGDTWEGEGYLWWLNIWNTSDILLDGNEKYHNIVPQSSLPLEGAKVYRSGENEWVITVDQCGQYFEGGECPPSAHGHSGRYIAFWETYYQGIEKPIGKSGKSKIESQTRRALGAATPFKFITKWTRY